MRFLAQEPTLYYILCKYNMHQRLWFHISEAVNSESSLLIADVKQVHLVLANAFGRHSAYLPITRWNVNNMRPPPR